MTNRRAFVSVFLVALAAAGCRAGFDTVDPLDPDDQVDAGESADEAVDAAIAVDSDGDGISDDLDNCPMRTNRTQADSDGDEVGDVCDCEPNDRGVAARVVHQDSLNADRGLIAPAIGFPHSSWSFANAGYEQGRLANDTVDAAHLKTQLTDVRVSVTAASTNIDEFDSDDFRQLFVVARSSSRAEAFGGIACGVEFVEGLPVPPQTSIVKLSGAPASPTQTLIAREDRQSFDVGDELTIVLDLRGSTLTCSVTIDGTTTLAVATTVVERPGLVGFFTRETEASFREVKVCSYRPESE